MRLMQPGPGMIATGQQILASTAPGGPIVLNSPALNAPNIISLPPSSLAQPRPPITVPATRLPHPPTPVPEPPKPPVKAPATPKPKSASSAKKAKVKKEPVASVDPTASKSTFKDDDDYNDVTAMGGVNLHEESQKILAATTEMIGQQIRSCKDETFLPTNTLHQRVLDISKLSSLYFYI